MQRYRIGILALALITGIGFSVDDAWGASEPDFNNSEAVLKDVRAKIDACSEAKIRDCMVACGYAGKTLKNFLEANPGGDPSILKQRWQPCFEAYRDADLPDAPAAAAAAAEAAPAEKSEAPKLDRGKFVIADLQLGGDMNSQKSRFSLLEAYGYHKATNLEHKDVILQEGTSRPGPDVIQNYAGSIREAPVYIHFEATADGELYMIQFEQKEDMEVETVEGALIERFGKPTRHQGRYLIWGCDRGADVGICVKANVSDRALTIWASDGDLKASAHKAYRKAVLEAKGTKSGAKF